MALNSNFRTLTADNIEGLVDERNYLKSSFENGTTTGWTEMSVALTSGLPTGTPTISASAASSLALSATSVTPLSGSRSLLVDVPSALTAGHGFISDEFTLDRMDLGKVLTVAFDYERVTGTYNFSGVRGSQTWMVYIYDATLGGANWIQPAGFLGMNQSSGPGRVACTFQSSVTAGQKYRVAVIASQAAAGASSIEFDNFTASRQTAPIGPVVTDWVSYTPTITNLNAGTAPSQFYRWRRVGDSIQILGNVTAGGTGIGASGQVSFTIPSGLSFDTSKLAIISETTIGTGSIHDSGSARLPCSVNASNSTSFHLVVRSNAATGGNIVSNNEPSAGWWNAAGDSISFELMAPISGWSSNVQLSNDTDTRVVAFAANKSATQSIPNTTNTVIDFNSVEINTHGSTYAAGAYTVPVSGYYKIAFNFNFSTPGSNTIFGLLFKNGLAFCRLSAQPYSSSQSGGAGSTVIYLNAGENVSIAAFQSSGSAQTLEGAGRFSVERLSGPSVVAASESVSAAYYLTAAQSISASDVQTIINFNQKDFDSHNAVTTGAGWKFTAPISGKYRISTSGMLNSAPWAAGNRLFVYVLIDGVAPTKSKKIDLRWVEVTASPELFFNGTTMVDLVAGQYIQIAAIQSNASAKPLSTSGSLSPSIEIERVGN